MILIASQAPFDHEKWQEYLATFMIVADLPFTLVEHPEFRKFVRYTRGDESIQIPSAGAVKRKVMAMSGKNLEEVQQRFQVCL
jgi:hypothetical protein